LPSALLSPTTTLPVSMSSVAMARTTANHVPEASKKKGP
jgi:hypothetical protein